MAPPPTRSTPCAAFAGTTLLARGPLSTVLPHAHARSDALVFSLATGKVIDLDLRGGVAEALARLSEEVGGGETVGSAPTRTTVDPAAANPGTSPATTPATTTQRRKRGRPKLGVVAKEVTLLPRHWQWLSRQPKSASASLRELVEARMRATHDAERERARRDATYALMSAVAGDLPGFEEAARALFRGAPLVLLGWPEGLRTTLATMLARTSHRQSS